MDPIELDIILDRHNLYNRSNGKKGQKADLSKMNLSKADLSGAYLAQADLSKTNLSRANLSKADLSGAYLSYTDLSYTDLSEVNLLGADLSEAYLVSAKLAHTNIQSFQYKRHFAFHHEGWITIGCLDGNVKWWISNYKRIGKIYNYTKEEIKAYGMFIKLFK